MVTYNHEKFIEQSIDSILNQSERPYKIIVSDDSSKDKTWSILSKYANTYPDLIEIHQNEKNLGVFENIAKMRSLSCGNVISLLAGDDKIGPNCIKAINDTYRNNEVDLYNDKAIVITNSAHLHSNGKLTIWDNYIEKDTTLVKKRLRYSLSFRGKGYSIALFDSIPSEEQLRFEYPDLLYGYDFVKGFEEIINVDQVFYSNVIGEIYRLGVGVTSVKNKSSWVSLMNTHLTIKNVYFKFFDKKDLLYIKFIVQACEGKINPSLNNWYKTFVLYVRNLGNFGYNNPALRNFHFLLPDKLVFWLKVNVFPLFLLIRKAIS
jgi:glycosyltransferase involved in cell wall biosynthesis